MGSSIVPTSFVVAMAAIMMVWATTISSVHSFHLTSLYNYNYDQQRRRQQQQQRLQHSQLVPTIRVGSRWEQLYSVKKNNNNNNNNKINKNNNNNIESAVEISFPTSAAAMELGIRDWPQQFHSSSWTEFIIEGGIATRYILDGNGRLSISYYSNDDPGGECRTMNNVRVYPGTLIEVNGEATLQWTVDDSNVGMIVLTPTYEEGGKLALVGAALVVFCMGLIIGSTSGSL